MAHKTNSFERLWKELKRRKVVHVITVYAAASFVILQLVDLVSEPLRLPVSTKALVLVFLCVGFIIAVLLSWIYDITPTGVRKTKPVSELKHADHSTHEFSSGWKIATYISAVIIIALVVFNFAGKWRLNGDITKIEKSIAVLPFINDSPDTTNTYFINGIMERITTNLQMIKEFRVISRTSVEQYRNNKTKSILEIAKELDVNYIIEGSGQRYGNSFSVTAQLIKAKGKETHLWAKTYDQEIKEVNDYIRVQSQIAQAVAKELQAIITPQEKQLIDKTPTTNLTAYDFYQRGNEELVKYSLDNLNREALERADDLYGKALKYDSTFAQAYTGLAFTYWFKNYWNEFLAENFMDSVLFLCDIAISIDPQLAEAHTLKGAYYSDIGKPEDALKEFDRAIKFNPNDWLAYFLKGRLHYSYTDLVNQINSFQKAASINRGPELPMLLYSVGLAYFCAGFPEKSKYYYEEKLKLDTDSAGYYSSLSSDEFWLGNYNKSIELGKIGYAIDSTYAEILNLLGRTYAFLGSYEESLKYYKKYIERLKASGVLTIEESHRFGYIYWQNGYKKDAEYYFTEQIKYSNKMIELKRSWEQGFYTYYDLAGVYAFKGEKDKAFKNLRIFNQIQRIPFWMSMLIKTDPLFNSIRNEPEFLQIARDVEAKYQSEHERVKRWLEETGQL